MNGDSPSSSVDAGRQYDIIGLQFFFRRLWMQLDFTSASMLNDMVQSSVDAGRLYVFARYIPSSSVDAARRSQNIAFREVWVVRGCSSPFCFA